MSIIVQVTAEGPATGLLLSAEMTVDISEDGTFADFCITNTTTPTMDNPDPLIDQALFNLAGFDPEQNQLQASMFMYFPQSGMPVAANWAFENSAAPPPGGFDHNSGGCGLF